MFRKYLTVCLAVLLLVSCASRHDDGVNVLILAPQNLGANYYLLRDVIEEYGWNVTHTGVLDSITPCPWFANHGQVFPLIPDVKIEDLEDIGYYDCLMIAPSTGNAAPVEYPVGDIIDSPEALRLIRRAAYYGLAVFATCVGVRTLAAADVIRGHFIVGSPRFRQEYINAGANYIGRPQNDNPPTIDGNIVTCARGQYYNYANVMAIATVIESNQGRGRKDILNAEYINARDVDFKTDDVLWAKNYGGAGADGGRAFCMTREGGCLLVGYTFAPGAPDADMLVIKTDADGNMIWSKRFGGAGTEYGNACTETEDGYLILGYTTSFGAGSKDLYLLRIDDEGNEVWSKTFGGVSWDVGTALCQAGENRYFVCGFTHSFGYSEEDIYVLKIDGQGNTIWSKTFSGWRIDMANSVHATDDGGCVIAASSGSHSANTDFYLAKIDAAGEKEWSKSYNAPGEHGHGFDWCKGSSAAADGGWILTGYSDCNDMMDVVVVKTDSLGDEQWLTSFGNKPFYEYGNAVCQVADGGYVIAGMTKAMVRPTEYNKRTYDNDIYLAKLNAEGAIVWDKTIGGQGAEWANAVHMSPDGDFLMVGHSDGGAAGSLDVLLIRIEGSAAISF
jgi:hypothetical protein